MKSKNELNKDIFKITKKIQEDFPELIKYLGEIPANNSNNSNDTLDEINRKTLTDYYNTLNELLKDYSKSHSNTNN
jgi:iron uptake system EfeUOB component EfeO/EfeM